LTKGQSARGIRRANQARSFLDGNRLHCRHAASLQWCWTRFFSMSPRGEIAFPMPFNKENVALAVKFKANIKLIWDFSPNWNQAIHSVPSNNL
jgi:hypothetical protein